MSSASWSNRTITTTAFEMSQRSSGLCQLALSYDGKCAHHHITPSRSNRTNTNNGIRDFGAESNRTRSPSSPRGLIVQRFRNKTLTQAVSKDVLLSTPTTAHACHGHVRTISSNTQNSQITMQHHPVTFQRKKKPCDYLVTR